MALGIISHLLLKNDLASLISTICSCNQVCAGPTPEGFWACAFIAMVTNTQTDE